MLRRVLQGLIVTRISDFRVFFLGDQTLQVRAWPNAQGENVVVADAWSAKVSPELSHKLHELAQYLGGLSFVRAVICAFDSVTLMLQPYADAQLALHNVQLALKQELKPHIRNSQRTHLVKFSRAQLAAEFLPDLAALAAHAKRTALDYLAQFCASTFTVAMIGFKPGFPYLLGLPEALAMPRLANPRISVPRGSVAIGGGFAGIYPARSAGGWHVIGVTNTILFDPSAAEPCLFSAGDTVRFQLQDGAESSF